VSPYSWIVTEDRYLTTSTRGYWGVDPLLQDMRNYASPKALYGVAEALAHAHRTYGNRNAIILFVVQPNERNVFDQALLEHELHYRWALVLRPRHFHVADTTIVTGSGLSAEHSGNSSRNISRYVSRGLETDSSFRMISTKLDSSKSESYTSEPGIRQKTCW